MYNTGQEKLTETDAEKGYWELTSLSDKKNIKRAWLVQTS